MLRAGSVESACTQLGLAASSMPPAAAAGSGAAPAPPACATWQPPSNDPPGSCGSEESLQTSLDVALLQASGSDGSAASAPAAQHAPQAPQPQPLHQAAAGSLHSTVPPAFLAELAEANACVQRLPLPGESRRGARGVAVCPLNFFNTLPMAQP